MEKCELDDCTEAFKDAKKYMRRKKMKKIIEAVKRCFKKESYADQSVYKINISIMIASCVLFCLACVLFFL